MDLAEAAGVLAKAGIEGARFEAQLLLGMVLGVGRATVVAGIYPPLSEEQSVRFRSLVEQRALRVPFAYIRGTQEFYGHEFFVSPAVLVPRPETELLVEQCLARLRAGVSGSGTGMIADVGTGTGCIPIALLAEISALKAVAFDISLEALRVAERNGIHNGVADRLRLVGGDLLSAGGTNRFDLIVSNPPYIPRGEIAGLQAEVSRYEPRLALDGGEDGLDLYRRLVVQAMRGLCHGGWLCVEVGAGQAQEVELLMLGAGYVSVERYRDFAGIERLVCGQNPRLLRSVTL